MTHKMLSWTVCLVLGAQTLGCGGQLPKQDKFKSEGGISPDPAGVLEGSVVYVGPRPSCDYHDDKPTRVRGRVALLMFQFDNPPPPEGTATTADNLLLLSGDELFTLKDCLPKGAKADPEDELMRSAPFRWPQIPLTNQTQSFQIRGFYDSDEDMNPFFSVTNLPTAGDVAGAALVSLEAPEKGFLRIRVPPASKAKNGYLQRGITVGLGNYVWLERPVCKLSPDNRQLDAETPLPLRIDLSALAPDTKATLRETWQLSCHTPGTPDCGFALESLDEVKDGPKLQAAGVELDFSPQRYAYAVEPIDVKTIVVNGADKAEPDGIPDPHPLLGASLPVPWLMPAVVMQRRALDDAQAQIEQRAGIPSVLLLGTPLLDETATKQVFVGRMNVAIPPIAVVELEPGNEACRIPYVPPGNTISTYESRLAYCHDMPTGVYGVNVLHGVAGGQAKAVDAGVSDNGFIVEGGGESGQAWTLPNELALAEQVGDENVLPHQGADALYIVHDPNPDAMGDCKQASDPLTGTRDVVYRGVCRPGDKPFVESDDLYGKLPGIDSAACLPQACCDAVAHLCDLPLCKVTQIQGLKVRSGPSKVKKTLENGLVVPDCVPFEVPALCCKGP